MNNATISCFECGLDGVRLIPDGSGGYIVSPHRYGDGRKCPKTGEHIQLVGAGRIEYFLESEDEERTE
jgi:hypothetical protein